MAFFFFVVRQAITKMPLIESRQIHSDPLWIEHEPGILLKMFTYHSSDFVVIMAFATCEWKFMCCIEQLFFFSSLYQSGKHTLFSIFFYLFNNTLFRFMNRLVWCNGDFVCVCVRSQISQAKPSQANIQLHKHLILLLALNYK